MFHKLNARLLAGAMALGLSSVFLPHDASQAALQVDVRIGFDQFYSALSPHGRWFHHARWGDVWQPRVRADFRPYRNGQWEYTDVYGWVWVSGYDWGDIPFHYGRWVYDPADGWLWIPGYVWAPAWVLWRSGNGYVGWVPMPPDNAFLAGDEIYPAAWNNADRAYGYMDWYGPNYGPDWFATDWVFVNAAHFADRDYGRYAFSGEQSVRLFRESRDETHYATVNNYVVNRSIDPVVIGKARGRPVAPVQLRQAIRANAPVAPIDIGREVQQTEHRQHGGDPQAPANARVAPLTNPVIGRGNPRNAEALGQPGPGRGIAGPSVEQGRQNRGPQNRQLAEPGPGSSGPPVGAGPAQRQREAISPPELGRRFEPGAQPGAGKGPPGAGRGLAERNAPPPATAPAGQPRGFAEGPRQGPGGGPGRDRFGGPPQGQGPATPQPAFRQGPPPGFAGPPTGFAEGPRQGPGGGPPRGRFAGPPAGPPQGPAAPPPRLALGPAARGGPPSQPPAAPPPAERTPRVAGPLSASGGPPGDGHGRDQREH